MPNVQTMDRKKQEVEEIGRIFNSNGAYMFDYRGLSVKEMNEFRVRAKELDAKISVIKNRYAIKYFESIDKSEYGRELFQGPTAVAYADEKFVEVAKLLVDFDKTNEKVQLKAGFIENTFADVTKIKTVASLPGKDQLMAQFAGAVAMPIKKMGIALSAPLRNMLILMNNLKDKKENEEKE